MTLLRTRVLVGLFACGIGASGGAAQTESIDASGAESDDAFLDPEARALHSAARARWHEVDRSLVRYQAVVRQRMAVGLRLPLRDRMLFHRETAARVIWEQGGATVVQLLGFRSVVPGDEENGEPDLNGIFMRGFAPGDDPLLPGIAPWYAKHFEHPLDDGAELHYRFGTGDTIGVLLPDGRSLRAVELVMQPRRDDPFLLSGALWVEPGSGNLVRAVYRMARPLDIEADTDELDDDENVDRVPGLLRPFIVEMELVAVDYALWDFRVWMPLSMRVEGTVRAGVLSAPLAAEIAYEMEDVVTVSDSIARLGIEGSLERLGALAQADGSLWQIRHGSARSGRPTRYLIPEDPSALAESPHLPEPVWAEDRAFAGTEAVDELEGLLADLPDPVSVTTFTTFDWGMQRPDLIRYNGVEGLSIGARAAVRFGAAGGPLTAALTARLGSADFEPRATLELTRATRTRSLSLSIYRELHSVDPSGRPLGVGNSVSAFLFGRDDGDYYQATGVALSVAPPSTERAWYGVSLYAERQDAVTRETDASVLHWIGWDRGFRAARPAARANQVGVELALSPWWGRNPGRLGGGIELRLQGERGDFAFERVRMGARAAVPLPLDGRFAIAAAGGMTRGASPPQRNWILGGPLSARGFAPGVLAGPTFLSGRVELLLPLARAWAARGVGLALFSDGGWAGSRSAVRWDDAVASAGVGLSILDGVLRLDAAWGWKGPAGRRLSLYLDGLL